ncbi:carbohydrate kinase family protein [Candidatus Enterococcus murrayae]|uniref:Carbohydrate kinase n=1 Tax=Candidatus Enterococcus murrayae TaxID=2815321 RepID=A0ABS3HNK5_9ENTE|nr:PfkB family carbohydrate kinase [Enterococcus sp. MJM16]MBO0454913.1 carbohydrate kinase [Enterococcus sp. MJM16]
MSILCIGQAVYDLTFPVNEPLIENQKYRIPDRHECMGAPAANAAYLCGTWGAETSLIARIGNDLFGQEILQTLKTGKVDISSLYVDHKQATSISCIVVNEQNGHRTILNSPMKEQKFPIVLPQRSPDVLLVDGHELNVGLEAITKYPNAVSIMDAGTYKPELKELIQAVDYLVCSEDFAYQATGIRIRLEEIKLLKEVFKQLRILNKNQIVITIGDQGCIWQDKKLIYHFPAFKVTPVDTTGAGDIFHGAFAFCTDQRRPLEDSVVFSSAASALSVKKIGGQTSITTLKEVNFFIAQEKRLKANLLNEA